MRDYDELVKRLKESDDNCHAECYECPGECLSSGCNIFSEAADAIEELVAAVPKWHPVSEPPKRTDPRYARQDFIVRLEGGHIMSLTYEFDNSDRCRDGCEPLFPVGWRKTARPVTHWTHMPKFYPPKEETE